LPDQYPAAANVHLSAIEHKDNIVFLHAVKPGPASQSYGLQVAQLAGIPQRVIRAARKNLALLEAHSIRSTSQYDLFATDITHPPETMVDSDNTQSENNGAAVMAMLAELEPDVLSPREALDALYRLKRLVDQQPV
jgi:DNA mismatch repair protein MutS